MDNKQYLSIEEIIQNVGFVKYERRLKEALIGAKQEKKLTQKAVKIWEGIIRHKPFENNEIPALIVADAFLRKNGFKYKIDTENYLLPDLYCWYLNEQKQAGINGQFLNFIFPLEAIKRIVPVWGILDEHKEFINSVKIVMESGEFLYEQEAKRKS